jgi:MoaA/NifB/PqqE/SkfB family radical SAM enzyme
MASARHNPRFASLFVTRKCNFGCPYCKSIRQTSKDISLERWKAAIDKLHSFGVRLFTLTGGEPLVRQDVMDIIRYITKDKKSICWLISNFSLIKKDTIDLFINAGLQFITSSFDTLSLCGEKSDQSVLDLLSYAKSKGIIASTLTVVTSQNISEIPAIVDKVTSRGIIFDMGLYQHVGGLFSPDTIELKPDLESVRTLFSYLKKKKRSGLVAPSWSYLNESLALYETLSWKCSSDKDAFIVVNNDGRLMPCQEYSSDVSIFDVQSLNIREWRDQKKELVTFCDGCFYGCYYQKMQVGFIDALFDAWSMLRV